MNNSDNKAGGSSAEICGPGVSLDKENWEGSTAEGQVRVGMLCDEYKTRVYGERFAVRRVRGSRATRGREESFLKTYTRLY